MPQIQIIGVPEEEDKKKDYEKILEEIIVENFPKMGKEIIIQVQETQRCPCSLGKALGGHLEMLLAVGKGGRWAVQACPLHACSCVWRPNSEPSPDV